MNFEFYVYLYMIIGFLYGLYDWNMYQKLGYEEAVKTGNIESGMLPIYWILMISIWPLFVCVSIYKYFTNKKIK